MQKKSLLAHTAFPPNLQYVEDFVLKPEMKESGCWSILWCRAGHVTRHHHGVYSVCDSYNKSKKFAGVTLPKPRHIRALVVLKGRPRLCPNCIVFWNGNTICTRALFTCFSVVKYKLWYWTLLNLTYKGFTTDLVMCLASGLKGHMCLLFSILWLAI